MGLLPLPGPLVGFTHVPPPPDWLASSALIAAESWRDDDYQSLGR